jgi:hypothetical protein
MNNLALLLFFKIGFNIMILVDLVLCVMKKGSIWLYIQLQGTISIIGQYLVLILSACRKSLPLLPEEGRVLLIFSSNLTPALNAVLFSIFKHSVDEYQPLEA